MTEDLTDDWMNPPTHGWIAAPPKKEKPVEYLIERERRIQGPLTEWAFWMECDTADERDAALRKLQSEHPMWRLRARDRRPALERFTAIL